MPNRLILKVTKFQLPPPTRLGTVVKNILGGHLLASTDLTNLLHWTILPYIEPYYITNGSSLNSKPVKSNCV